MSLIDKQPRAATVTATEKTKVIRIQRDYVETKLAYADPIIKYLLMLILRRFRQTYFRLTKGDVLKPVTEDDNLDIKNFLRSQEKLLFNVRIISDLQNALKRNEFQLHYQPIISIKDKHLVGFEALIRWIHPKNGIMSPIQFLDIAEYTDQIFPISIWTFKKACQDLKTIYQRFYSNSEQSSLFFSINLSARQLIKIDNVSKITDILKSVGIPVSSIKLEITETVFIDEPEHVLKILTSLRDQGFNIILDDFGTGFSSLSHLQRFPVNGIKIDRSFVSKMLSDHHSMEIVQASIDLARALKLDVIAEGVETENDVKQLLNFQCKFAQGYYFAKPLPLEETIDYVEQYYKN